MVDTEQEILQKHLVQFLVRDVFNTITIDDILRIKAPNVWEWKGKPLSPEAVVQLREQAGAFQKSLLWQVLKSELQWHSVKSLLEEGKSAADIRAAQLLGYLTSVVDKKLEKMGANSDA